jgi:hypothetical protein
MPFIRFIISALFITSSIYSQAQDIGTPFDFSNTLKPGDNHMNIQLLGALKLSNDKVNNLHARELSGLAWDEDEQLLYAVSDDGHLVHLSPLFTDGVLTGLKFINAYPLRDSSKKILVGDGSDAESLAIINDDNGKKGDSILIVSLEAPQRLHKFKTDGTFISELPLPENLYVDHINNDESPTLDALSFHQEHGVIMAPVKPLTNISNGSFSIYSTKGQQWHYAPLDKKNSATLGMETLAGGNLLIIERVYSSMFKPVIYALRELSFEKIDESAIKVKEIAHFNSREGWMIDNFEGVARHKENHYFMVSDDNESTFQKTLLIYFKILEDSSSKLDAEF